MKHNKHKSLQYQYIVFTSVLLFSISAIIIYNLNSVTSRYSNLVEHNTQSAKLLSNTLILRTHIIALANALDVVMLEPEFKEKINSGLKTHRNEMFKVINTIQNNKVLDKLGAVSQIEGLSQNISALNDLSLELIAIRSDTNLQYPSILVSSTVLRPAHTEINSLFSLAMSEAMLNQLYLTNIIAYDLLIQGGKLWSKTVASYRLYLANRFGAFNETSLLDQENDVDIMLNNMQKISLQLQVYAENETYDLEATDLVDNLPQQLSAWITGFAHIKEIHHSSSWRRDAELMRTSILPLVNEIMSNLITLDKKIQSDNINSIDEIGGLLKQQSIFLILIILIFITYSFVLFKFLKQRLFTPLQIFSNSLRLNVSSLKDKELISLAKTKEIFSLINAYIGIQQQNIERHNELSYQALHDSLTSLPNRKSLIISLKRDLKFSDRDKKTLTFLMIDLNGFKEVNDTLGHHIGDLLLVKVGERLKALLREIDVVARLGGDEFSIILPSTNKEGAALVAQKINQALAVDFSINEFSLRIGASIGIAEYPKDGKDHNVLIQHADVAMYNSKANKLEYSLYHEDIDENSLQNLALTQDLSNAIKNDLIELHYQPKIMTKECKPIGYEALLRWSHTEYGAISPEKTIQIAENSGQIDDLTLLIFNKAITDHLILKEQGYSLPFSINLSVLNLKNQSFINEVESILNSYPIDTDSIIFEITESAMMLNPEKSIQMMNQLSQLGINLSVDDFGTGFSSLSYLKKLPVTEMKIDRSFIQDIANDKNDEIIVKSTIDLAHNLGLTVVAEGVEDKTALKLLQNLGCDVTQGYYFSKPLPFEALSQWLKSY